jgi:ABC-type xylose transport system substrate-binding protein
MLTRGVDVLILTPVNGAAALVRTANRAAKVPVGDYNFLAPIADMDGLIGRDAAQMAESIAQAAIKQAPSGNSILALGESTSVAQEARKGDLNVLKPDVDSGKIKIVSEPFNKGWSTESARAAGTADEALSPMKTHLDWGAASRWIQTDALARPGNDRGVTETCELVYPDDTGRSGLTEAGHFRRKNYG